MLLAATTRRAIPRKASMVVHACAAEKAQSSYSEFVAGLLRTQWHDRQESALEWRIRRANLPERWSLETFSVAAPAWVSLKQMRAFGELDFVAKHENLVLVGPTGRDWLPGC